jgi:hypothetical protein
MGRMRQSLGRAFSRKELTINNHKRQRESAYTRDEMVARAEERLVMAFFSANHCLMRAEIAGRVSGGAHRCLTSPRDAISHT